MSRSSSEINASLLKSLRRIICATDNDHNDFDDIIYKRIKKMTSLLFLPVIGIHLSDAYMRNTIIAETNKRSSDLVIYENIFNYLGIRMFFNDILPQNKPVNEPFLLRKQDCEYSRKNLDQPLPKKIKLVFHEKTNTADKSYCMYISTPYEKPPTMTAIIEALTLHLNTEYMPKSSHLTNPLSHIMEDKKGDSRDSSKLMMLETLVNVFHGKNDGKKRDSGGTTAVVKIIDDTITPRTFKSKNGTCHLTMVVNQKKRRCLPTV